jgi:hypothetical protein
MADFLFVFQSARLLEFVLNKLVNERHRQFGEWEMWSPEDLRLTLIESMGNLNQISFLRPFSIISPPPFEHIELPISISGR